MGNSRQQVEKDLGIRKPFTGHPGAHSTIVEEEAVVVEDLPLDAETSLVTNQYIQFAEFLAYVRDSRISVGGELHITLAIPYEHKYDAMPLTDARGVTFIMQCHRPMTQGEIAWREKQEEQEREEIERGS